MRGLVMLAVFLALGIPAALIGIPWTLAAGDISLAYGWAMEIMRAGLWAAGISVEAEWRAELDPERRYLFFSNHVSNLDPPVLLPLLPGRTSVFIKKSLTRIPVLGYGMKLAGFIPVSRDGTAESAKESVDTAVGEMATGGVHITSFVEGTRSLDGRLLPFKKGPFYLAMDSGAAVVPVTIVGTRALMPKGSLRVRGGVVMVVFHAPIEPRDFASREELMEAVRGAIRSGLPPELR